MPLFVKVMSLFIVKKWKMFFGFMTIHFFATWGLLAICDPGNSLILPENYFYFYFITISTIGYGDFSPLSLPGKIVVVITLASFGIVFFSVLITVFSIISNKIMQYLYGGKHMKYTGTDHILFFSENVDSYTEEVVSQLRLETDNKKIVLVTHADNPVEMQPDYVDFYIRVDLHSEEVLKKSNINKASSVIILGRDNEHSMIIASNMIIELEENDMLDDIQIVFCIHGGKKIIKRVKRYCRGAVECVPAENPGLIANAVGDPGSSEFLIELGENDEGREIGRYYIPENSESVKYLDLMVFLTVNHDVQLLQILAGHKPRSKRIQISDKKSFVVESGMSFYYTSADRLTNLDFSKIPQYNV